MFQREQHSTAIRRLAGRRWGRYFLFTRGMGWVGGSQKMEMAAKLGNLVTAATINVCNC